MSALQNLGYIVIAARKLSQWEQFATKIIGMTVGSSSDSQLALRIDEHPWRVLITEGNDDDLGAAGWDVGSEEALHRFVDRLRTKGASVKEKDPTLRSVSKLFAIADPVGFEHEFYFGRTNLDAVGPTASEVIRGRGFVTGDLGMGHIVSVTKSYEDAVRWYREVLDLSFSDRITQEIPLRGTVDVAFFHTATGRHHSLAAAQAPGEKRLNHFMLEYRDMSDVGAAFDRARAADIPIVMDLGQHPNDQVFSFYAKTPSGFDVELGYGGIIIDDKKWQPKTYHRMSEWGHRRTATPVK